MKLAAGPAADLAAWCREQFPREACGVIVPDGSFVPLQNVHPEPEQAFRIVPGLVEQHKAIAIVHSHPRGWRAPSLGDMRGQRASGVTWGIVWLDELRTDPAFWWDGSPQDPDGQPWRCGVTDCWNLIRYQLGRAGHRVPDPARAPGSDKWLTRDDMAALGRGHGFARVDVPQIDDVVLLGSAGARRGHLGVLLSDGSVWHHASGVDAVDYDPLNLPRRSPLDVLQRAGLVSSYWRFIGL